MIFLTLAALLLLAVFVLCWAFFYLTALLFLSLSFTFSYFFVWNEEKRKAICPHGLFVSLFLNK